MIQIEDQTINFTENEQVSVSFSVPFTGIPSISALPVSKNVEIFVSNLTESGCILNASSAFTGAVRIVAMRG